MPVTCNVGNRKNEAARAFGGQGCLGVRFGSGVFASRLILGTGVVVTWLFGL